MAKKGIKWNNETLIKRGLAISLAKKGKKSNFFGKKHSDETKLKISKANTGKKRSKEFKKNLSEIKKKSGSGKWMLGRKLSKETCEKMSLSITGKKHWNWKGGITSEEMKIRNSKRYKEWRKSVLERDNYTCKKCGKKNCALNVHHIEHLLDNKEKAFDIDNGLTLCLSCHRSLPDHIRLKTPEEKENLRKKLLGRKHTEEAKKKMSLSQKGKIAWNKGNKSKEYIKCKYCGKVFYQPKRTSLFCSKHCSMKYRYKYLKEQNLI